MKTTLKGNQMIWIYLFFVLFFYTFCHMTEAVGGKLAYKRMLDLKQEFKNTLPHGIKKEYT